MPSPINSLSTTALVNNLFGPRNTRNTADAQGILDQVQGGGQADNVAVTAALDMAKRSQQVVASAKNANNALNDIEDKLNQMRSLAKQAATTTDTTQRQKLSDQFNKLQKEVNDIGANVRVNGKPLLAGVNSTQKAGVQVSGRGGQDPADNGVKEVQVKDKNTNSRFAFIDTGNGKVTAIRYDKGADGVERQTASQTIDVTAPEKGKTTTANFDKLGVKVTLDDQYAAGKLQGVQAKSGPQAAPATAGNEVKKFNLNVNDQKAANNAVAALDTALTRVGTRRDEITAFQNQQLRNIRDNFTLVAKAGTGSRSAINVVG